MRRLVLAMALTLALGATSQAQTPSPAPPPPSPSPSSSPVAVAPPDTTAADDAAKLADFLAQDTATSGQPSLNIYGFADFNYNRWLGLTEKWQNQFPEKGSFSVGRLNVYLDGNIAQDWKSLIEVRYLFVPNGALPPNGSMPTGVSDPVANSGRFNGLIADYTEYGRPIEWNGINVQRAYLEHTFTNYLSVRFGHFLTPWGIWNVDHGSPVIIGTTKPYVIEEAFFPEAQTGLDAFGSIPIGEATLGYHLTLSNGRGPTDAFYDLDENKALGGRLSLKLYRLGQIDVGFSGYGGTYTDKRQELNAQRNGVVYFTYEHYREISWAVDLRWLWKGLHLQTEAAVHDRVWDNDARPITILGGVQPDLRRYGAYFLLGYRLPWLNLMPYAMYQYYDTGARVVYGGTASRSMVWSAGLNVRIKPSVVFKLELQRATFANLVAGSMFETPLDQISAQLAWAF